MSLLKAGSVKILTSAATIQWNLGLGADAQVTLTMNGILANPTGMVPGTEYSLKVIQDATGGRTLGFGTAYKFEGGVDPVITAAANAVDILTFGTDGTSMLVNTIKQNLS
ncbi:MAG: hypothetical protein ACREAU_05085 [Nitrosopumilaceae archaeon]